MRCYAKVRLGWEMIYLGFFWKNSAQEDAVALDIEKVLKANPGAVASVSEECTGALADLLVIGEFPIVNLSLPVTYVKPTPFTDVQRRILESMRNGEPRRLVYKEILSGRALVAKGLAEHAGGRPEREWWLMITDAGRAKLGEQEVEAAE